MGNSDETEKETHRIQPRLCQAIHHKAIKEGWHHDFELSRFHDEDGRENALWLNLSGILNSSSTSHFDVTNSVELEYERTKRVIHFTY